MIKKHKLKVIIIALGIFFMKSVKYYSMDDVPQTNHTLQDEVSEFSIIVENILEN